MASGGAPPRGQRGQQGFMGKDLSATGEDILPAFPSSCGRSPRPRFSSAGGPPLSQLGCLITPPVLPPGSSVLTPGRPGQLPGTAGCTQLGAEPLPGCPSPCVTHRGCSSSPGSHWPHPPPASRKVPRRTFLKHRSELSVAPPVISTSFLSWWSRPFLLVFQGHP